MQPIFLVAYYIPINIEERELVQREGRQGALGGAASIKTKWQSLQEEETLPEGWKVETEESSLHSSVCAKYKGESAGEEPERR